jgi:hypothetical protein
MAVQIVIDKIETSKELGGRGKLRVTLSIESPRVQLQTDVAIDSSGNLHNDLDGLRQEILAFAQELVQAADHPLRFG